MRNWIVVALLGLLLCGNQNTQIGVPDSDLSQIQSIMDAQEEAWNRGSLDDFMNGYWKSDSLIFIGKSGVTYGWSKTLDNYKKSYKTKAEMGQLHFENIKLELLSPKDALVIGKWTLLRKQLGDTLSGHYSLNWQKKQGNWVIIADHSS